MTYELLTDESGYNILDNGEVILYQPEPYIPYRVLNEDGTTDYAASAQSHITACTEEQDNTEDYITLEEQLATLQAKVTTLETANQTLTDCLLEISESVYA